MIRRKYMVVSAAAALLVALGLLAWMLPRQLAHRIDVVFLGYTNKPGAIATALLLVSNSSSVPLEIRPLIRAGNVVETNGSFEFAPGFVSLTPGGLPRTLAPHQAETFDVSINAFRQPWWTEVAAWPSVSEPLFRRMTRGINPPRLRGWIDRVSPPIGIQWIGHGPITNLIFYSCSPLYCAVNIAL